VPNTILPYLFTTDSDGQLGTANWELYGRVAQDPSIIGRAEEEMTTTITTSLLDPTEPETTASTSTAGSMATQVAAADADGMDTTFLITDALPRGWGIESDRGDLYAVPLITVASVCLAALIFCFIVMWVGHSPASHNTLQGSWPLRMSLQYRGIESKSKTQASKTWAKKGTTHQKRTG
jgi:hypothetical protein